MNEPEKFTLEFQLEISPKLLYTLISTPEGLAKWFAETVLVEEDLYRFGWEGSQQSARLVQSKNNEFVRFMWLEDYHKDLCLELKVLHDSMSTGVSLLVTDYSEAGEMELTQRLWHTQVGHLKRQFNS